MSLFLLSQLSRQIQPSSYLRATRAAAVRLNSTSTAIRDQDNQWNRIVNNEVEGKAEVTKTRNEPVDKLWKKYSESFERTQMLVPRDAYSGRSAKVQDGDVATAARLLDRVLGQNAVQREWHANRRHRQKGEERRRVRSVRWRRRFKQEVGKMVQLVQQIRRRGA